MTLKYFQDYYWAKYKYEKASSMGLAVKRLNTLVDHQQESKDSIPQTRSPENELIRFASQILRDTP